MSYLRLLILPALVGLWAIAASQPSLSAMQGGEFEIYADNISTIGGDALTGGDYTLLDTLGEGVATNTADGTILLQSGFQATEMTGIFFRLGDTSLNLGSLNFESVAERSVTVTAKTESATGYSIYIFESDELRDGNTIFSDVADGNVSLGQEEYGIGMIGSARVTENDLPILSAPQAIFFNSSTAINDSATVTFKAAISRDSRRGSYSHDVTFTMAVNP